MRRILLLLVAVLLSAPALGVTIDFEALPGLTPVAYAPGDVVPTTARLSSIALPGGGEIRFKTKGGGKYAGLVTHLGTTSIVPVTKKGKITQNRFLEISLKGVSDQRIDSLMLLNAGEHRGDDPSTPGTTETDFLLGFDNPGAAQFVLRVRGKSQFRNTFRVLRNAPAPLDLTQLNADVVRITLGGSVTIDDLVISTPAPLAPAAVPEPLAPALLGVGTAALVWLRRRAPRAAA